MRFDSLDEWLAWQETLHPSEIELGLDRVKEVLSRLGLTQLHCAVISIAGTNGKGSTLACLESIYCAAGYKVGAYSSPHLLHYNERIRIEAGDMADAAICNAFEAVDQARGDISLTYFEFGTLAAIWLFSAQAVDLAILEVGLGGRLDAVNAVDPQLSIVTSVGIDHVDWLGSDRETIAREKAGIFRADTPAIYADPDPPRSLIEHGNRIGAQLHCLGREYGYRSTDSGWSWNGLGEQIGALPFLPLAGDHQLQNAAAALMAVKLLAPILPVGQQDLKNGLADTSIKGRFHIVATSPEIILDVAHNSDAMHALARSLEQRPCKGDTHAVIGMLADKESGGMIGALGSRVDHWYVARLNCARAMDPVQLSAEIQTGGMECTNHQSVVGAVQAALDRACPEDRILVTGSFYTVADALQALGQFRLDARGP